MTRNEMTRNEMTCDETRRHLREPLEQPVSESFRQRVEEHLAGCPACQREAQELAQLRHATAELPGELAPQRDLWPGIESRLTPRRRRRWLPATASGGLRLAAGLALAAVSAWLLVGVPQPTEGPTPSPEAAAFELPGASTRVVTEQLRASVERHRDRLPPAATRDLEDDLALLERAIGEIRGALRQDPGSSRLHLLLASRYQQEMGLLRRIERL